jgi:hypothetical protein
VQAFIVKITLIMGEELIKIEDINISTQNTKHPYSGRKL